MRHHLFIACLAVLAITLCGCAEKVVSPSDGDSPGLSERQMEILDSLPRVNMTRDQVILPNGISAQKFMDEFDPGFLERYKKYMESTGGNPEGFYKTRAQPTGPQDAKNQIIGKMTDVAIYLTDRSEHTKGDSGYRKPAQTGLAYIWGGKNYRVRKAGRKCDDLLFGLDCSGLFYNIVNAAGIAIPEGNAERQRSVKLWENILKGSKQFEKIRIKDLGSISTDEIETGDMIYWMNDAGVATHIGVVLARADGRPAIYQSYGSGETCREVNDGKERGPCALELKEYWLNKFGRYSVLRLTVDISGQWECRLRCHDRTYDAMTVQLTFPGDEKFKRDGGDFVAHGEGTDYDGSRLTATINANYDPKTNILQGRIDFDDSDGSRRSDSFTCSLDRDDTGYVPLTNVVSNGGCNADIRLLNLEKK